MTHNHYAAEQLRHMGVGCPVTVVPMSFDLSIDDSGALRSRMRSELGFSSRNRVIGMFGFVTASKRPERVLEAFALAARENSDLRLLIVGEPAPNCDLDSMIAEYGLDRSIVKTTGYIGDEEFDAYLAATDRVINLRYPTAGETSGALLRVFAAGRPVAVSGLAQFVEFPPEIATRIPLGDGEIEALRSFMLAPADASRIGELQRRWLNENAGVDAAVEAYLKALTKSDVPARSPIDGSPLPLFPALQLEALERSDQGITILLRNMGESTIRSAVFGTPGYRVIVKVFAEGEQVLDRWVPLAGDLGSGEEIRIHLDVLGAPEGGEVRLYHALEGIPTIDELPFAVAQLQEHERA
jgi:hypothetical protein